MKVVERAGMNVKRQLQKSYPFEKKKCGDKCFVCISEGKGNCKRSNVSYEIVCTREGCESVYIGETCRNGYCRGREHLRGLEKGDEESVLVEHIRDQHQNDMSRPPCHQFKMNITECHNTALDRQVTEAVKIDMSTKPTLNRKHGFRANSVLKLSSTLSRNTH